MRVTLRKPPRLVVELGVESVKDGQALLHGDLWKRAQEEISIYIYHATNFG